MAQLLVRQGTRGGTVRIGGPFAIPAVLGSLGVGPAEVLAEQGLDPKLFDDPDNLISSARRSRIAIVQHYPEDTRSP